VEHHRSEPVDGGHRVDALPEQARRIHFRDVGSRGLLDEALHGRRVEHQVLGVHLDRDLDAVLAR